jgi:hypothetical protein
MGKQIEKAGSKVTGFLGRDAGDDAAEASLQGANIQAQAQRDALNYLKEREAIPQQYREGALNKLGGLYGLEGGEGNQQELIDRAKASPLYSSMLEGGEDAVLRSASMTGGLRSGNSISDVKDVQNDALLTTYNQQLQGLQGLANLPSNANNIASGIAGIGTTLGQGTVAAGQADAAGRNAVIGNMIAIGQTAASAGAFSDIRLKENIKLIGNRGGHNYYSWDWNNAASDVGMTGADTGYMAHEIYETNPEVIGEKNGYITINLEMLEVA